MKIGLISEKFPPDPGGLAVSTARLARGLASAGWEVRVFCLAAAETTPGMPGALTETVQDGARIFRLQPFARTDETLAAWFDLITSAHHHDPFDLLHGYYLVQAGFMAVYAAHFLGLPSVVSARGNDLDRALFDPAKAAHILYALQYAQRITANTYELLHKAEALAPGLQAAGRMVYIPNGVDVGLFQPQSPSPELAAGLGLRKAPVLGFSGEARSKKGLAALLLAFAAVNRQHPLELLIAGGLRSGPDKDLFKVFKKQNPELNIVVAPYVPLAEMPAIYAQMDILALPSLHDGLPNALLEGMACGRPIVASSVGGMLDVLRPHENALLTAPGSAEALTEAILALLAQPDLASRLAAQARQDVLAKHTLQAEINANLALYGALNG